MLNANEKKDLELSSEIITRLNLRRVELNKAEEDLQNANNSKDEVEQETNRLRNQNKAYEERLALLALLKESKERELKFLAGRVINKELLILNSKNLTTAEHNKLEYLAELRQNTSNDLKKINNEILLVIKKQSSKHKEIDLAEKHLELVGKQASKIQRDMDSKSYQLSVRETEIKNKEVGLQNTLAYIERTKQRLQKFINEHNLGITL